MKLKILPVEKVCPCGNKFWAFGDVGDICPECADKELNVAAGQVDGARLILQAAK